MKTLHQIQKEALNIGMCTREDECRYKEDHFFDRSYCKDFENETCRFCGHYADATSEDVNEYYLRERLLRIEIALKLPEE
jgi:hypothetical protein